MLTEKISRRIIYVIEKLKSISISSYYLLKTNKKKYVLKSDLKFEDENLKNKFNIYCF